MLKAELEVELEKYKDWNSRNRECAADRKREIEALEERLQESDKAREWYKEHHAYQSGLAEGAKVAIAMSAIELPSDATHRDFDSYSGKTTSEEPAAVRMINNMVGGRCGVDSPPTDQNGKFRY